MPAWLRWMLGVLMALSIFVVVYILFAIPFTTQTAPGTYTMVIEPNVSDSSGNLVDQNLDGVTDVNDRFTVTFTISLVGTSGADAFGYTAVCMLLSHALFEKREF